MPSLRARYARVMLRFRHFLRFSPLLARAAFDTRLCAPPALHMPLLIIIAADLLRLLTTAYYAADAIRRHTEYR